QAHPIFLPCSSHTEIRTLRSRKSSIDRAARQDAQVFVFTLFTGGTKQVRAEGASAPRSHGRSVTSSDCDIQIPTQLSSRPNPRLQRKLPNRNDACSSPGRDAVKAKAG